MRLRLQTRQTLTPLQRQEVVQAISDRIIDEVVRTAQQYPGIAVADYIPVLNLATGKAHDILTKSARMASRD